MGVIATKCKSGLSHYNGNAVTQPAANGDKSNRVLVRATIPDRAPDDLQKTGPMRLSFDPNLQGE